MHRKKIRIDSRYSLGIICMAWLHLVAVAQSSDPFLRFADRISTPQSRVGYENGFSLAPQEIIAWFGGENMVRLQNSGILESRLLKSWGQENVRFRCMAWEGDTVYSQNRDLNFGSLRNQLEWVGASSVWMQFGTMEALDGIDKIPEFIAAYSRLIDQVAQVTPRIVLITPTPYEPSSFPYGPDLLEANHSLTRYVQQIQSLATSRGLICVDLFSPWNIRGEKTPDRLTDNGIHWNGSGQKKISATIARQLSFPHDASPSQPGDEYLNQLIRDKNKLWFDCWRPMNWAFAYGDRTTQLFAQPAGQKRWLKEELEDFKSLITKYEEAIFQYLASGVKKEIFLTPPSYPGEYQETENPQIVQDSFSLAEGYTVNLYASEESGVVNPTQIAWSDDGRLFVACSPTYPHIVPGQPPADYILVCEDTDGDGYADHTYKYAEGLHMVQGIEPFSKGLYVCAGTEIIQFMDEDHDGQPDSRRILLSGFGTGDAHQLVNSICHGPDGYIWMTQGLHILSNIETVWGISRLDRSGVWRFDPATGRLDGFFNGAKAGHNCWGVAFDDQNQIFHKTGDRPHGYYSLPGLFPIADPVEYHPLGSLFQTPMKTTSLDFVGTKRLPSNLQGSAILGGFMKHTVESYQVLDDGAGFRSVQQPDILISSAEEFRPVDVSIGPDGGIYVCDFHNKLIGHYQTSYRDPSRDHSHGRIWRIAHPASVASDASPKPALNSNLTHLVREIASEDRWIRHRAKRILFYAERSQVIYHMDEYGESLEKNPDQFHQWLMHAFGIYRRHQAFRPEWILTLSQSPQPDHRAYSSRIAGYFGLTERVQALSRDSDARVRLESLAASIHLPAMDAFAVFLEVFSRPRDRFLDYALANAVRFFEISWADKLPSETPILPEGAQVFIAQNSQKNASQESPGQKIYTLVCSNCHQPDGLGIPGIYPPLTGNPHIAGDPEWLIKILLHGLSGPLEVSQTTYNNYMPPSGLTDESIATVLNFVRHRFGNAENPPVSPQSVAQIRALHGTRSQPWNSD